jgi:hypothetical protein
MAELDKDTKNPPPELQQLIEQNSSTTTTTDVNQASPIEEVPATENSDW